MKRKPGQVHQLACALLALVAQATMAVTSGFSELPVAASDGKTYGAKLAIGMTVDGGKSWQDSANLDQHVVIKASIDPAAVHVGGQADIFVVELYANQWTMLTSTGAWVPWSTKLSDLQPMREDMTLAASQELTIFEGGIATAGEHRIFVGYMPEAGSAIIYTGVAAPLQFAAAATDPLTYFEEEIFADIVMTKCTLCHVADGVASISDLHFVRDASKAGENFTIFADFYSQQDNAFDYVLTKVSGGNGHVGGIQLPLGSGDYQKMAAFLGLLDGATSVTVGDAFALLEGLTYQDNANTLRDAALLFAGRLPTDAESAAVTGGGDAALRATVTSLMSGAHFRQFLKDAANDRLFVRGQEDFNLADDCPTCFPDINAEYWRLRDLSTAAGTGTAQARAYGGQLATWISQLNYSMVEAPLELIAYVVENDKPYSEILTANYDMLSPVLNAVTGGTAVFPAGASGVATFAPGQMTKYYLRSSSTVVTPVPGSPFPRITNPGTLQTIYPHVGVLNSKAFLARYPSTATNRNRARARWTWYHFLGVDVEALAKRTTDPVALADTNNPTMNNPACTVCHSVLDPVAGTFQDYGDNGQYRSALNGTDSLDRLYKQPRGGGATLYQNGDTWYRDMRPPGFDGVLASGTNTTRWLAEQIVQDERFATSTVRFWWPAVFGAELLAAPEVTSDANYAVRLAAYEAEQAEIERLSAVFVASGLSAKALLTEMVLSPWFRAEGQGGNANSTLGAARALTHLTGEKLLTPEQLARKTGALTGFSWSSDTDATTATTLSGLEDEYNTFYGGIDSFALKIRARSITPLMSNVAATHALEASCPIVMGDFIRADDSRYLFGGLSPWTTPLTQAATTATIASSGSTDFATYTLNATLQPGASKVVLSLLNDACTYGTAACATAKNLVVGSVAIRSPGGQTTIINGNAGTHASCAVNSAGNGLTLNSSCAAEYAFTATTAGIYTVTATLAATQTASDPVVAGINVEANGSAATSTAAGASAIKDKLVEIYGKLLGQTLTVDSSEILAAYDLLVQTWQERKAGSFAPQLLNTPRACNWSSDIGFISTLGYPGSPLGANGRYNTTAVNTWLAPQAQDALFMKQSWVVVMTYLLSHYDYLHE